MKRNIIGGIILIGALALGSCSTTKLASNQSNDGDDVYYSNAKAGDQIEYVASTQPSNQQSRYNNYNDDDYYFYNSYASRINRFGYFSPFGYYDDIYNGYYPYYGRYSAGIGFGLGFGYGYGGYYGYSPFYDPFYSGYYGYGYPGYYGYNYFGTGYGYGPGGGYWGGYSAYRNSGTPRPYRGSGAPSNAIVSRSTRPIGYNGNYPVNSAYPGRPTVNSNGRQATNSTGNTYNNGVRPVRGDNSGQAARPVYQPQQTQSYSPPPSSNSGSSSSSSGSSSSGGSRPVRP
ncbi:hypothetical protein [Mucilaginibacter boryungensis]|uniref:Vitellogenin II n=1 Tax=Mucilaginibacter boryungensis TaxID=768480 RepID=A0ABR9XHW2_9SPHI|nr:hypothetical protein [Mucilaginibacter boryungensis]MBE9666966.1 hypothetical protein [Mucilaginibacter boryungensis]